LCRGGGVFCLSNQQKTSTPRSEFCCLHWW
jgi:hypothetical protein